MTKDCNYDYMMTEKEMEEGANIARVIINSMQEKYTYPNISETAILFFAMHIVVIEMINCIPLKKRREEFYMFFEQLSKESFKLIEEENAQNSQKPQEIAPQNSQTRIDGEQ